jgi:hypothetical protein
MMSYMANKKTRYINARNATQLCLRLNLLWTHFALGKKHWRRQLPFKIQVRYLCHGGRHPYNVLSYTCTDHVKALQLTTKITPLLVSAGLTPSCHPLLALTGLHKTLLLSSFSADMSQKLLDETIRTAAKHYVGLSALLLQGHPVRAVAQAELGKLLAVDEPSPATSPVATLAFPPSGPPRLKAAYETLVCARNELMIGFGRDNDGGELGRNIRETLVSLEKELGVWTQGIHNALQDLPSSSTKMNNN